MTTEQATKCHYCGEAIHLQEVMDDDVWVHSVTGYVDNGTSVDDYGDHNASPSN